MVKKKSDISIAKIIPVALDDILRFYEAKQSVCTRNKTLFTILLLVIHSLRQTV